MTALRAIGERRAPADWDDIEPKDQGFSIFDGDLRLVTCNRAYTALFDLPEELSQTGTRLVDLLRFYASRGDYGPGNVEDIVRERFKFINANELNVFRLDRPGGRVLEVRIVRTPDGGLVSTFSDVTERERARERVHFQAGIINQIQEAVVVCDKNGIITFWNEGAHGLWGFEAAEVIGRHNEILYLENTAHTPERDLISQIEQGGIFFRERQFRRKDGVPFWGRISLSIMNGTDDDAVSIIACIQNISQYRAAREARKSSEAHLRATLNTVIDGIATIDDQGRILSFNAAAERIFGYSAAEVIGNNVAMLMCEADAGAHDGYMRNFFTTSVAKIIDIGREVKGRRSDGTIFPLELAISEMRLGDQKCFAGVMRDISAKKETELILNRQAKALATLSEGVMIVDLKFEIVDCNPAVERIFGYSKGELPGRPVHVLVANPEAWKRQLDSVTATVVTEGEHFTPIEFRRKDGSTFSGERLVSSLLDESGKRTGMVAILRDTTERIRTEEMLRQAQKMEAIGQLTGGIAHDFNNLLAIIQGNLELAAEDFENGTNPVVRVEKALGASIRGAGLVQRLLSFSRKQTLSPIKTDVRGVITGMDALLRSSLGSPIDIDTVFAKKQWRTKVDPAQLENALLNLAINARDAMPKGGTLTVETANVVIDDDMVARYPFMVQGAYITVSIADSGVGMPPDVVSQVFEPFFTTKDVGKGSGLGLSMVYGFVKQSGGYVIVESEVDSGTVVTIYLPRI